MVYLYENVCAAILSVVKLKYCDDSKFSGTLVCRVLKGHKLSLTAHVVGAGIQA